MTEESRMKTKGNVVDYVLLIGVGIGLIWGLYDSFIVSTARLDIRVILLLISVLYIVTFKKRIRQIQSSTPKKEAENGVDILDKKVNGEK